MAAKRKTAKYGLKAAKATPAKAKLAKGGLKLGKRRAERTPAGTAVLYGQALAGNERAREDLRKAFASARKAYSRTSDRRGRPDIGALIEDRKAQREAGKAVAQLREALRIASRTRRKPERSKKPLVALVVVAGAGTAVAANEDLRSKLLGSGSSSDKDGPAAATATTSTPQSV